MAKLVIQLVAWNGAKYIPHLFESLRAQTFQDWELLALDNNSSDNTAELIKKELANFSLTNHFIQNETNLGFAGGHNKLFKQGKGEYVLLLNQDMYLDTFCLEYAMAAITADEKIAAVSPRLMKWEFFEVEKDLSAHPPAGGGSASGRKKSLSTRIDSLGLKVFRSRRVIEQHTAEEWSDVQKKLKADHFLPTFGVSGALPIYRRTALEHTAFSDGTFLDGSYHSYKEDVDLAFRLRSAGYETGVVLDSVAWHDRTAAGPKELSNQAALQNKQTQSAFVKYHSYKNHLATLYKNEYGFNVVLDFPWILWYEVSKFMYYLLLDRAVLKGLKELWQHRKDLKAKRRLITSQRQVSWSQIRRWW